MNNDYHKWQVEVSLNIFSRHNWKKMQGEVFFQNFESTVKKEKRRGSCEIYGITLEKNTQTNQFSKKCNFLG